MGITSKGISYVDEQLDAEGSFLWEKHRKRSTEGGVQIPAAGRFVQLDHNSRQYKETMKAGEALIEAVRTSNEYGESNPQEREQRVAELEAGYRLLRAPRVNPIIVKGVLYGVLTYLITKFADEPIGELARVAWTALKQLFGFS